MSIRNLSPGFATTSLQQFRKLRNDSDDDDKNETGVENNVFVESDEQYVGLIEARLKELRGPIRIHTENIF